MRRVNQPILLLCERQFQRRRLIGPGGRGLDVHRLSIRIEGPAIGLIEDLASDVRIRFDHERRAVP